MRKFIIKITLFLCPIIVIAIFIEFILYYNNTFFAKSDYIEHNKDSIEMIILGSSQNWRAINPQYLDKKVAPLAHGGSTLNIDYLLFSKYLDELPNLKVVFLETSYHTLDDYRDENWNKNHLFYKYYGINNYKNSIPLSENFLISANTKEYLKKAFQILFYSNNNFNKYGYELSDKIYVTLEEGSYGSKALKERHNEIDIENFNKNIDILNNIVKKCNDRNLNIVFLSPPKYKSYNDLNISDKIERRDAVLKTFSTNKKIFNWNYEREFENNKNLFYNEDHMNKEGAELFTKKLNHRILKVFYNN